VFVETLLFFIPVPWSNPSSAHKVIINTLQNLEVDSLPEENSAVQTHCRTRILAYDTESSQQFDTRGIEGKPDSPQPGPSSNSARQSQVIKIGFF
jgi:hypothetical protein